MLGVLSGRKGMLGSFYRSVVFRVFCENQRVLSPYSTKKRVCVGYTLRHLTHEMDMPNANARSQRHLYSTGWRRGLASGNANFQILDTNMLVSPMQNSGVGGIAQRQPPTPDILRSGGI